MRHDWIFDVLSDLVAYAEANGLTATAAKAADTLRTARAEAAMMSPDEGGHSGGPVGDAKGRAN